MNLNYSDPNNQLMPDQPLLQQLTASQSNQGGFMNYIKNHKLAVAIAILILIFLIWWFCMRKKAPTTGTNITVAPNPINGTNIKVTKSRPY